jgi:hypothetical protein
MELVGWLFKKINDSSTRVLNRDTQGRRGAAGAIAVEEDA